MLLLGAFHELSKLYLKTSGLPTAISEPGKHNEGMIGTCIGAD